MTHYSSLSAFCRSHSIQFLPRPHATWRLVASPVPGEIIGLGNVFRGMAVATNGIIVALETSAGNILFGHLQWFIKDDPEQETDLDLALSACPRCKVTAESLKEFEDLML